MASRRQSTTIARGNVPVEPNHVPPPLPAPRPEPTPEDEEKLIRRGTLMAIVYAEVGSYAKVAELFGVAQSTIRWWVHETKKRRKDELLRIADRLRGDVAQLAVDRVQEGLLEGETQFAAELGRKVLHGLGELQSHSSIKSPGPAAVTNLTVVVERADPTKPAPEVIEGAVLGRPYELKPAAQVQTAAEDDE